jgi:hypothetical protein
VWNLFGLAKMILRHRKLIRGLNMSGFSMNVTWREFAVNLSFLRNWRRLWKE